MRPTKPMGPAIETDIPANTITSNPIIILTISVR